MISREGAGHAVPCLLSSAHHHPLWFSRPSWRGFTVYNAYKSGDVADGGAAKRPKKWLHFTGFRSYSVVTSAKLRKWIRSFGRINIEQSATTPIAGQKWFAEQTRGLWWHKTTAFQWCCQHQQQLVQRHQLSQHQEQRRQPHQGRRGSVARSRQRCQSWYKACPHVWN